MGQQLTWLSKFLFIAGLAGGLLGCALWERETATPLAESSQPTVTIQTPTSGQTVVAAETVLIQSEAVDRRGIARIELTVNEQMIRIDANPQPEPDIPFIVAQPWTPAVVGSYTVQVTAYNTANLAGQSQILLLEVVEAAPSGAPESGQARPTTPTEAAPSPTATTAAATSSPATATATTGSAPTTATATAEPTPIPLPTLTYAPTGLTPDGRFKDIWHSLAGGQGPLGYPTGPAIEERNYARQRFAGGFLFWWDNPDGANPIWVLSRPADDWQSGLAWRQLADEWTDDKKPHSCPAAQQNGDLGPVRGFGLLWCGQPDLATALGQPVEVEAGSGGNAPYAMVQFFQGGLMFYNPSNAEVYVLLGDGRWQRFRY